MKMLYADLIFPMTYQKMSKYRGGDKNFFETKVNRFALRFSIFFFIIWLFIQGFFFLFFLFFFPFLKEKKGLLEFLRTGQLNHPLQHRYTQHIYTERQSHKNTHTSAKNKFLTLFFRDDIFFVLWLYPAFVHVVLIRKTFGNLDLARPI